MPAQGRLGASSETLKAPGPIAGLRLRREPYEGVMPAQGRLGASSEILEAPGPIFAGCHRVSPAIKKSPKKPKIF
jgi:hypothetical protein